MKIVVKEINEDGSKLLLYLMTDDGIAINAKIITNEEFNDEVRSIMVSDVIPYCTSNGLEIVKRVERIKYKEYINEI